MDISSAGRVSLSDLLEIYLQNISQRELNPENIKCILRYLHRIGVIVWYEEIDSLKTDVFLRPSILISLFKVSACRNIFKKLFKSC